jgi:hypothetical protein
VATKLKAYLLLVCLFGIVFCICLLALGAAIAFCVGFVMLSWNIPASLLGAPLIRFWPTTATLLIAAIALHLIKKRWPACRLAVYLSVLEKRECPK